MNSRSEKRASVHPKLRSRLRELTSEAILEAAEVVFSELGPAAGMDAIAQQAGVAVGTLYNHFRDRDTLVDALFEARAAILVGRVDQAIRDSAGLDLRAQLMRALEGVVGATAPNARFREVFLLAEQRKPRKEGMLERLRVAMLPLFDKAQREGALKPDPKQLQAAFFLGLLRSALMTSSDAPEQLPRSAVPAVVVDQFLDGARGDRP